MALLCLSTREIVQIPISICLMVDELECLYFIRKLQGIAFFDWSNLIVIVSAAKFNEWI